MITPTELAKIWINDCHVLDTETTGLDGNAEIVEISIIDQEGNTVLDTLVKPAKPIPADATRIHGITNEIVAESPTWAEIHDQVCELIDSRPLAIYNASYDVRLMQQTAALYGKEIPATATQNTQCAMLAYAEHYGDWNGHRGNYRWQSLVKAADQQSIEVEGQAHRALCDCQMTLGVIQAMANS